MMKSIIKSFGVLFCIIALPVSLRVFYLVITSFAHDYTDKVWQPYKVGDSLEYINNKEDTFKWCISEIEEVSNPSDPLLVLNHRIFTTFVYAFSKFKGMIIDISVESGVKTITFWPRFRLDTVRVIENEKNQKNVEPRMFNQMEVLKITPHERDFKSPPFLDSLYWSSYLGYMKVFYSDGEYWELKSFIRNGKLLYELKE